MLIDTCTMRSLEIFQERDLLGVNVQKEAKKPPKNLWLSLGNEQLGDESIFAVEKKNIGTSMGIGLQDSTNMLGLQIFHLGGHWSPNGTYWKSINGIMWGNHLYKRRSNGIIRDDKS